jgi:hypothetical protein
MGEPKSVEALVEEIEQVPQQFADLALWVPERLTLKGAEVSSGVAMAVVLDRALRKGFMPNGFTQAPDGRTYHYKR